MTRNRPGIAPNDDWPTRMLEWSASNGRRYPWRGATNIYRLAVAEVLLQKTSADAVLPVWSDLMSRYPNPSDLLSDSPENVKRRIEGLGLGNQRQVRLRAVASALETGNSPLEIEGLGSYGKAILALSVDVRPLEAPVDGNIARVIRRFYQLHFEQGEPRKKPELRARVQAWMDELHDNKSRLALIFALVDLGHSVCRPSAARCTECPLREGCATGRDSSS